MKIFDKIRHAWRRTGYGTITESRAFTLGENDDLFQSVAKRLHDDNMDSGVSVRLYTKYGQVEHGYWNGETVGFNYYPPMTSTSVSVGDRMFSFEQDGTLKEIEKPCP